MKHLRGQIHGKYRTNSASAPIPTRSNHKTLTEPAIPGCLLRFCRAAETHLVYPKTRQSASFCYTWVIFSAFFVDNKFCLTYDFLKHFAASGESDSPLPVILWFFLMATVQKNLYVSEAGGTSEPMPATAAARPDQDVPSPENLLQEYKELRERFQRTTNALGSAAHDLKTPLTILNGYVELLQSEKLGPLSDRQQRDDARNEGQRTNGCNSSSRIFSPSARSRPGDCA